MNATFIYDGYEQWSSTINVHSYIYEHTSCMINDHRNSYDHWSSMIIDHNWHSNRSMIVAMECCWSYMISVDQWVISWSLIPGGLFWTFNKNTKTCNVKSSSSGRRTDWRAVSGNRKCGITGKKIYISLLQGPHLGSFLNTQNIISIISKGVFVDIWRGFPSPNQQNHQKSHKKSSVTPKVWKNNMLRIA